MMRNVGFKTGYVITVFFLPLIAFSATITSIDFKAGGASSQIEITADGPVTFEKQENTQDNQVVLEIKGAMLAKTAERKLDTSSFNSPVSLISPYRVDGQPDTTRVVVQLRGPASVEATQEGNKIQLSVPNSGETSVAVSAPASQSSEAQVSEPAVTPSSSDTVTMETLGKEAKKDNLSNFADANKNKRFTGKPITLQVRDADLTDIFRLIGEASGFNMIVAEDVRGKITLSLVDVPWDQVLDVILSTKQLGAERNNNILRIVTLSGLTAEKQAEMRAKQASLASAPRVTKIFPVSYAKPEDLRAMLTQFGQGTADPNSPAEPTVIQVDARTNSIVIKDVPENIERMKKIIELLDTQTPQVLIEAKIIEATEGFSRSIGGSLGFGKSAGAGTKGQFFASIAGGNPIDALISSGGTSISNNSANGGSFGFSPKITFLPGLERLNAILNIGESENQIKVVASPKTVVLNKESATITQGTPVLVPGMTFVAGVGSVPTTTVQSADLNLNVKPTVTNDGNVLLTLSVSRGVPVQLSGSASGVAARNMSTVVVVESGTTLVIGGIYTMSSQTNSSGFPFLRKIPILGWFFGSESEQTDRSELFIFITPRILNEKESGMTG